MLDVIGGLELERGVLDVEVVGEAGLERGEDGRATTVAKADVVDHDVRAEHGCAAGEL